MNRPRQRRRESALRLAADRARRSPREQLALVRSRPGASKKETLRLLAQIKGKE